MGGEGLSSPEEERLSLLASRVIGDAVFDGTDEIDMAGEPFGRIAMVAPPSRHPGCKR